MDINHIDQTQLEEEENNQILTQITSFQKVSDDQADQQLIFINDILPKQENQQFQLGDQNNFSFDVHIIQKEQNNPNDEQDDLYVENAENENNQNQQHQQKLSNRKIHGQSLGSRAVINYIRISRQENRQEKQDLRNQQSFIKQFGLISKKSSGLAQITNLDSKRNNQNFFSNNDFNGLAFEQGKQSLNIPKVQNQIKQNNNKIDLNSYKVLKSREEMFSTDGAVTKNED